MVIYISEHCINESILALHPGLHFLIYKAHRFIAMQHANLGSDIFWDGGTMERWESLSMVMIMEVQPYPWWVDVSSLPVVDTWKCHSTHEKARSLLNMCHTQTSTLFLTPLFWDSCSMFLVIYLWTAPRCLLPFAPLKDHMQSYSTRRWEEDQASCASSWDGWGSNPLGHLRVIEI